MKNRKNCLTLKKIYTRRKGDIKKSINKQRRSYFQQIIYQKKVLIIKICKWISKVSRKNKYSHLEEYFYKFPLNIQLKYLIWQIRIEYFLLNLKDIFFNLLWRLVQIPIIFFLCVTAANLYAIFFWILHFKCKTNTTINLQKMITLLFSFQ